MNENRRTRSGRTQRSPRRRLAVAVTAAAAALALALSVGTAAGLPTAAAAHTSTIAASQSAIPFTGQPTDSGHDNGGQGGTNGTAPGYGTAPGFGNGGNSQSPSIGQGSNGSTQQEASPATTEESTGVVLIDTQLGYENAEAAGTGIVLSKDGLILTNNHVIADSTKIAVTVATTGKTYEASVVGSDSTQDVAVLQLKDAKNLQPATIDEDNVSVGDDVTAVGNSEGQGQLQAADGTVTDLGASVTTTAQTSEDSETLNDMIQVQADIVSGDSGGALLDSEGEVIGMNTAASSGAPVVTGFAIPIDSALTTAESIISGEQTSTNTLGYPAFLGIGLRQEEQTSGAVVAGVYEDTPAAEAGLSVGDTITQIGSVQITDGSSLSSAIAEHKPGDTVSLSWTDASGQAHTTKVTLTEGPAS